MDIDVQEAYTIMISDRKERCPVCKNSLDECICCPECGHVCPMDQGEPYCPVCGPPEPEDSYEE